ncbi:MAG: hypothetical protein H0T84_06050 [Tatlockia sp.]|nr:hypothetical protein [Tatlockia sp.]
MTNHNQGGQRPELALKEKTEEAKHSQSNKSSNQKTGNNLSQKDRVKGGKNSHKSR